MMVVSPWLVSIVILHPGALGHVMARTIGFFVRAAHFQLRLFHAVVRDLLTRL